MAGGADTSIVFETKTENGGFEKGMSNMKSQFADMKKTLVDVASASTSAFGGRNQAQINKYTAQLEKALNAIQAQARVVDGLKTKLAELGESDANIKTLTTLDTQAAKAEKELSKLRDQFDALVEKREQLDFMASFGEVDAATSSSMNALDQEMERVGNRMMELEDRSVSLRGKIAEIKANPELAPEAQKLSDQIAQAEAKLGELTAKAKGAEANLKDAFDEKPPMRFNKAAGAGKNVLAAMARGLKNVGSQSKQTGGALASLTKRIFNMAKTVLVFNLLRKAITEVRNYIGGLISANDELKTSLNSIKVNMAVAFQPIWESILPALQALTSALANAIAYLATFFAALSGRSYSEMKKNAEAMNKEKDAIKGVGGAAKESGKFLASFDQINQAAAENAGGGGGAADAFSDMFGEVEEPKIDFGWINELAERIKSIAPDIEYFENLGKTLSDKIINALDSIPWGKIKERANNLGQELAAFLNGAIARPELWVAIGNTLAEALNTAVEFLIGFAETYPWAKFGDSLAQGLNKFFDTFDWGKAGLTLSTWAEGLLDLLISFLRGSDWELFGSSIAEFLNGIKWADLLAKVATTIYEAIKGTAKLVAGFITTLDIAEIVSSLLALMRRIDFETIMEESQEWAEMFDSFWYNIGGTLVDTTDSLWEHLKISVDTIWAKFKEFFTEAGPKEIMRAIMTVLNVLSGAILVQLANDHIVKPLLRGIKDGFSGNSTLWSDIVSACAAGWSAISDFFTETIPEVINSIVEWFAGLPEKISSEFGKVLGTIGRWVVDAIAWVSENFPLLIEAIVKFFTELPGKVWNAIIKIKDKIVEFVTSAIGWVGTEFPKLMDAALQFFRDLPGKIKDGFLSGIQSIKDIGIDVWNGFIEGIKSAFTSVGTWVKDNIATPFLDGVKSAFGIASPSKEMDKLAGYTMDGFTNRVEKDSTAPAKAFEGAVDAIVDVVGSFGKEIDTQIVTIMDNILRQFASRTPEIVAAVSAMVNPMFNILQGLASGFNSGWVSMWNTINTNTVAGVNGVLAGIHHMAMEIQRIVLIMTEGWVFIPVPPVAFAVARQLKTVPIIARAFENGVQIPALAQGGLIPPNNPRTVIVGDNTREDEIVSPRSAIREEVMNAIEEMGGLEAFGGQPGSIDLTMVLDDFVIGKVMIPILEKAAKRQGVRIQPKGVLA